MKDRRHHAFFRSEYHGKDRDEDWNRMDDEDLTPEEHYAIHHTDQGKAIDKRCKELALSRYTGPNREDLIQIMREKRYL